MLRLLERPCLAGDRCDQLSQPLYPIEMLLQFCILRTFAESFFQDVVAQV